MEYLCQFNPARYKQYAVNVLGITPDGKSDYQVGMEGIAKTRSLFKKMGAPVSLSEVGIGTEKLGLMANQVVQDGKIGNYSKIGAEELLQILKDAL